MPIILRFRDLNIPLGETIARHRQIIAERKHVWWGWMRRQRDVFPVQFFAEVAAACHGKGPIPIWLYDSGMHQLHSASLARLWAAPGGPPLPSPETRHTPTYMSEAILPAWVKLTEIDGTPITSGRIMIDAIPTLPTLDEQDQKLLNGPVANFSLLGGSNATLWSGRVEAHSL